MEFSKRTVKAVLLTTGLGALAPTVARASGPFGGVESSSYGLWLDVPASRTSTPPYDINGAIAAGSRVAFYDVPTFNHSATTYFVSTWRNDTSPFAPRGGYSIGVGSGQQFLNSNFNFPPSLGQPYYAGDGDSNGQIAFVMGTGATLPTTMDGIGTITFAKENIYQGTTTSPASNRLPGDTGSNVVIDASQFTNATVGVPVKAHFSYSFTSQTGSAPYFLNRVVTGQVDADNNGSYESTVTGYFVSGKPILLVGSNGSMIISGLDSSFNNSTPSFANTNDYTYNYAAAASVKDWEMLGDTMTAPSQINMYALAMAGNGK